MRLRTESFYFACQVQRFSNFYVASLCQKKEYGPTRSIVRRIGTILSLEPYPRPYFQVSNLLSYVYFICLYFLVS